MTDKKTLAIASFDRYLATKSCALWGQAFDISDDGRRRAAAEWFVEQVIGWTKWDEEGE